MRFLKLKYIALIATWIMIAATWFYASSVSRNVRGPSAIVTEWSDLFERCRVSIENAQPIDVSGLIREEALAPDAHSYSRSRAWAQPSGQLQLLEYEYGSPNSARRGCSVQLRDEALGFTETAQADILLTFLKIRIEVFNEGGYMYRKIEELPPLILLAFGPIDTNPHDCGVISTISVDPVDGILMSGTGEQVFNQCSGPSLIVGQK